MTTDESLPTNLLHNFDVDLQQFYFDIIKEEKDIRNQWHAVGVRRALKEGKSSTRFDTSSKRCAYLMKHSPCFTNAVASYLLNLVRDNPYVMKDALAKGDFSICCLGGGPATDAVAVIRIVRALYRPYWLKTHKALNVQVSVVDLSKDWRMTAENVLQGLAKSLNLIGVNEIELSYRFYMADLTENFDADVKNAIKSADIITMIYFLSAVNESQAKDKSQPMLEKIMLNMKRDAFLFFLDSAANHHYKILNAAAEKRRIMREIYGPLVEEFYTLSIESVKKFLELYSNYFHRFVCMTNIFLSVSSWYKPYNVQRLVIKKTIPDVPASWKTPTEEERDKLIQKMQSYQVTVQRLVNARFGPIYNKRQVRKNRRKVVGENSVDSLNCFVKEQRAKPKDINESASIRDVPNSHPKCVPETNSDRKLTQASTSRQAIPREDKKQVSCLQKTGRDKNQSYNKTIIYNKRQVLENRQQVVRENSVDSLNCFVKEQRAKPKDINESASIRDVPNSPPKCVPETNSDRKLTLASSSRQAIPREDKKQVSCLQKTGRDKNQSSSY